MMQAGLKPGDEIPRGRGAVLTHEWPADCAIQGGTTGMVFARSGSYVTAFFEAFPLDPQTFIRGEGETVEAAEEAAWQKWQRVLECPGDVHEFETRGYMNGAGFCIHCGLFQSGVFDLAELGSVCVVCGVGTYWCCRDGKLYCEEHDPSPME